MKITPSKFIFTELVWNVYRIYLQNQSSATSSSNSSLPRQHLLSRWGEGWRGILCNYPFERNLINKKKKVKVTPYATIPIPIPRNLSNIKYAAEIDYWKHLTCYKFNFNKKTKTFRFCNINSVCRKHLICFKLNFNKKSKTLRCV